MRLPFMERVTPVVDRTIHRLATSAFSVDPVAGPQYSRQTSIISSAYKRHGKILETALRESLRESNRHHVWQEERFRVSRAADQLVGNQSDADFFATTLPYGETVRTVELDMVVFDEAERTLRAYEIKRGNGQFDAGKVRSIRRDLLCVQVLLKSYGETFNLAPDAAESKIIFYYGVRSIPRPFSLIGTELDEHFQFPVREKIEAANEYFKERLYAILAK